MCAFAGVSSGKRGNDPKISGVQIGAAARPILKSRDALSLSGWRTNVLFRDGAQPRLGSHKSFQSQSDPLLALS